jgi:hypothetical protein
MKITTLQISAAEQVLRKAVLDKKTATAKIAFDRDVAAFTRRINRLNQRATALSEEAQAIKKDIEANPKLGISSCGSWLYTLIYPKNSIKAGDEIIAKQFGPTYYYNGSTYGNKYYGAYVPTDTEADKKVDDFILGLKLGTAVMTDVQALLTEIRNS